MNRRFKSIIVIMLMLITVFIVSGCSKSKVKLSFPNASYEVKVGESLIPEVDIENPKNEKVVLKYSSNDDSIVKYENGAFIGVAEGQTKIRVEVEGLEKVFAEAEIVVLPADVVKEEYTVTFKIDDHTEDVKVIEGNKVTKPNNPVKEGYKFLGWFVGETEFDFGTIITADIILEAKFEKIVVIKEFTVIFDIDGATNEVKVVEGQKVDRPEDPTKEGYVFLGWFVSEEEFDFDSVITTDLTIVAKFEEQIELEYNTVTFHNTNRSIAERDFVSLNLLTDLYIFNVPRVDIITFIHGEGNVSGFKGLWQEGIGDSPYMQSIYEAKSKEVDADKPYFINQPEYNEKWVSYFDFMDHWINTVNGDQNFWDDTSVGFIRLRQYILQIKPANHIPDQTMAMLPTNELNEYHHFNELGEVVLPVLTKEGFNFEGWYLTPDFSGEKVTSLSNLTEDINLYAKWVGADGETYDITYNLNGGDLENPILYYKVKSLPLTLPIPKKDGYIFKGWYLKSDFSDERIYNIEVGTKGNLVFHAKWEEASEYDTSEIYVNGALTGKEDGDIITSEQGIFIYGATAFNTIGEALAVSTGNVYVAAGEYNETVTITNSDISLMGANSRVDANVNERKPESTISGTIKMAVGVRNITIDGFAFTGNGRVEALGTITNFSFIYNYVHDTATVTDGWKERTGKVGAIVSLFNGDTSLNNISRNITIMANRFENTPNYAVELARVENVYINSNTFKNFGRDAVRLDGGYNGGNFSVVSNEFINDEQSGYVGVYFRIYGGDAARIIGRHVIDISLNTFKNIGQEAEPLAGAISARNYQEGGARLEIEYNIFENNTNNLLLRNNGTAANHDLYKWSAIVRNNAFIGIPVNKYHTTKLFDSDTDITNPPKTTFDKNYFEDNEGNVINDLEPYADKLLDIANLGTLYSTREEFEIVLDNKRRELPISIAIDNPISKLSLYQEYQIKASLFPKEVDQSFTYETNNPEVAIVSADGKITALKEGTVIITVYSYQRKTLLERMEITITTPPTFTVGYEGNGALKVGDKTTIDYALFGVPSGETVRFSSSDESIATVDQNGLVTAKGVGTVIITLETVNTNVVSEVGFTVYGDEITDELLQYLISLNSGTLFTSEISYYGSTLEQNRIYNTVNLYLAAPRDEFTNNMLTGDLFKTRTAGIMPGGSPKYITVHDTGNSAAGSTAGANSNFHKTTTSKVSWHYTVGNDGIYRQLEDNVVAFHAGDGTSGDPTQINTGIPATGLSPKITVDSVGYYVINGVKSDLKAPLINGRIPTNADLVPEGLLALVKDGTYWMSPTYYNSSFKKVSSLGGNLTSIGIEMAVNTGSDVYWTWQKTAKLVAYLLDQYDLDVDRQVFHNNWSGKVCPQTMIRANMVPTFKEMVELEYRLIKEFSDYEITFESHNPEIINNLGRVINYPAYDTNVTYTITVKKDGVTQSITLNALVPGKLSWS